MHNNRNNRETVIIPQTIIVPTKSIIVASLVQNDFKDWQYMMFSGTIYIVNVQNQILKF